MGVQTAGKYFYNSKGSPMKKLSSYDYEQRVVRYLSENVLSTQHKAEWHVHIIKMQHNDIEVIFPPLESLQKPGRSQSIHL